MEVFNLSVSVEKTISHKNPRKQSRKSTKCHFVGGGGLLDGNNNQSGGSELAKKFQVNILLSGRSGSFLQTRNQFV